MTTPVYILGNGTMAYALAAALKAAGIEPILVSRKPLKDQTYQNQCYGERFDIDGKAIVLAFKPYALPAVAKKLKGKASILISILARTTLDDLKKQVKAEECIVAMPNIAAKYAASVTPYLCEVPLSTSADAIMQAWGMIFACRDTQEFASAAVMAGCVPAYLALMAEALSAAAVQQGIANDRAHKIVRGAFLSFSVLLAEEHPAQIREAITSPAGTTAEGLFTLEQNHVRASLMQAVAASVAKQNS